MPAVFSDAVRVELPGYALLFISGKLATDAEGRVVGRTMKEQTRQVLENLKAILEREGGTFDDVVRVRVYVTQLDQQPDGELPGLDPAYRPPRLVPVGDPHTADQAEHGEDRHPQQGHRVAQVQSEEEHRQPDVGQPGA